MAEFPALPLWTDAYLGDTTHLNALQHGAYLLLLMTAWRSSACSLPDDDKLLTRYARCSAVQWRALRPVLIEFFTVENGRWTQGRLTDEFQAAVDRREKAAANGRASALKRKGRHSAKRKQSVNGAIAERELSVNLTINPEHSSEDKSSADERLQVDPIKDLFDLGVSIMTQAGIDEKKARSNLGKWKKDRGEVEVMKALLECRRQGISEPLEWLTKRLRQARWVSKSGYQYRGDDEAVKREAEKRGDMDTYWSVIGAQKRQASG